MGASPAQLRRWLGPMPGRKEARAFSLLAIAVALIVCLWSLYLGFQGETFLGRPLGGDFVQFYVVGNILNHYHAWRIYDLKLAVEMQHSTLPTMAGTQMLVFGQAPYIAALFRPFALLSYKWAYVTWLIFSAALYAAGLALLFPSTGLSQKDKQTGYLLALSAMPFLFETWIGGQVSVLAFFAWALFIYCRNKNQRSLAGMALALLLFKPTLVLLPAAMLLFGRRWRMLAGFTAGAGTMALLSLGVVGWQGVKAWVDALQFDSRLARGLIPVSNLAKNIDAHAFLELLFGGASPMANALFVLVCITGFIALAAAWWRSSPLTAGDDLLWAATLCLTLVLSPYAPIYDSILLVPAAALVAGSIARRPGPAREAFCAWLVVLYMLPWITQSAAQFLHLQLFTLALAGFGAWTLLHADPILALFFSKMQEKPRRILDVGALKTAQESRTMPNQTGHQSTGRF